MRIKNLGKLATIVSFAVFSGRVASAGVLTSVPMQGGMVMPMISYKADEGRLRVMLDPTVPQLTPLLVSHPLDNFNPLDPWYDLLDPSGGGQAFSRRYGFVMSSMTDPLPAGMRMWIRKLSSTAGLGAYRYSSGEPKVFQPIFGTAGETNGMEWNGMMFHPVFTAAAGTNSHRAEFEVYLVNAEGVEVVNSSTGLFTLNWTNVPDGRPELRIERGVVLSWPSTARSYVLESADAIEGAAWSVNSIEPVLIGERLLVELAPSEARKFYRLKLAQ